MEELDLISVEKDPVTKFEEYLKKMRKKSNSAPSVKEIGEVVEQVRSQRYARK